MIRKNRLNKILIITSLLISIALILYSILRALETNIDLYLIFKILVNTKEDKRAVTNPIMYKLISAIAW